MYKFLYTYILCYASHSAKSSAFPHSFLVWPCPHGVWIHRRIEHFADASGAGRRRQSWDRWREPAPPIAAAGLIILHLLRLCPPEL